MLLHLRRQGVKQQRRQQAFDCESFFNFVLSG